MFSLVVSKDFINILSYVMLANAFLVFGLLNSGFRSYYGRYPSTYFGPLIDAKLAWFLQEIPALIVPLLYLRGAPADFFHSTANVTLFTLFCFHYVNRALIYPWRIKGGKPSPILIMFMALIFCIYNGVMQGAYLVHYAPREGLSWRLVVGVGIFAAGWCINVHSDSVLRGLRGPGETGYKIPRGGLFELVSGANFFGEIVEWTGFAIAAGTLPAAAFATFTFCNIAPRAAHHHLWYREKFGSDYPKGRRAVIPFVW